MSANNGGPAFPSHCRTVKDEVDGGLMYRGMTLRDYFAAKAMQGLMGRVWDVSIPPDELFAIWAKSSYALADAMLKARDDK